MKSVFNREQEKLPKCLGGKRAANGRKRYMKPHRLRLTQELSLETLGAGVPIL